MVHMCKIGSRKANVPAGAIEGLRDSNKYLAFDPSIFRFLPFRSGNLILHIEAKCTEKRSFF